MASLMVYYPQPDGTYNATRFPGGFYCGAFTHMREQAGAAGRSASVGFAHIDGQYWQLPSRVSDVGVLPICQKKCSNQLQCLAEKIGAYCTEESLARD